MDFEFSRLRKHLDSLGYFQTLSNESVPLVGKLLSDLKTTTNSLQKYMKIAQNVIREKENLELSTGLHKTDNSKLVKEYNDLQLTLLNYRSQTEKEIKELKNRILIMNEENSKIVLENDSLRKKLYDTKLDMKSVCPTRKTHGKSLPGSKTNCLSSDRELIQENLDMKHELNELKKELKILQCQCRHLEPTGLEISSPKEGDTLSGSQSQDKVFRLQDEVRNLSREKNELDKSYKDALAKQHEAMRRAIHLAERNRELEKELKDIDQMAIVVEEECNDAVNDRTQKLTRVELALRDALLEIQTLEKTISNMKKEKEESELHKDIVRTEKTQIHKMLTQAEKKHTNVNDQLNNMKMIEQDLNLEIDRLVQESAEQKRIIAEMEYKLIEAQVAETVSYKGPGGDGIPSAKIRSVSTKFTKSSKGKKNKLPKKIKQRSKDSKKVERKNKKRNYTVKKTKTNNKISHVPVNSPTHEENNNTTKNNFPADSSLHLSSTATSQSEFSKTHQSSTQTGGQFLQNEKFIMNPTLQGSQHTALAVASSDRLSNCIHSKKPLLSCGIPNQTKCCMAQATLTCAFRNGCCENMCVEHFQDLLGKEIERSQREVECTIRKISQERDHYIEEYQKCVNQFSKMQQLPMGSMTEGCLLCPKIQQNINFLQQENRRLSQEKITLMTRLEATRNDNEIFCKCHKSLCKRTQRERDLLKADVARLEEESDCLRDNLKELCQAKKREHDSLRQQIYDYECRLKNIESERGELMDSHNTINAQMTAMDKKKEFLEEMLRNSQDDFQNQKILYTQLKALHDHTDNALRNTQTQLTQLEQELSSARNTIEVLKKSNPEDNFHSALDDLNSMKTQLNKLDREKDDLLNIVDSKTEEIATLRDNLKSKHELIENLKVENNKLRNQFGDLTDRATTSNAFLRESETEISRLQKLLDETIKTKGNALEVNRKLQEELATMTREAITLKNQLTEYQDQIENLKLQSQQYIAEVKKAEDLLQSKEKQREDLLYQFKQLCKESNNLQSSNNVLESEASQSKVQLSVAMDHVNNLERRSETMEILINDYEKQIGLLTNQIAKFESERNQHLIFQERTEAELRTMRELCMKLDKEKEHLRMQMMDSGSTADKISDLLLQNQVLTTKLTDNANKLMNAEKLLSEARQKGVEMKLKDEDTINEIQFLKDTIADLEQRFSTASQEVDRYQEKALEYSNQIRHLRRQLTNERFHNASRADGDRFPSLVQCSCNVCSKRCSYGFDVCEKNCLEVKNESIAMTTTQKISGGQSKQSDKLSSTGSITLEIPLTESSTPQNSNESLKFGFETDEIQNDAPRKIPHSAESAVVNEAQVIKKLLEEAEMSNLNFRNLPYHRKSSVGEDSIEISNIKLNMEIPTITSKDAIYSCSYCGTIF